MSMTYINLFQTHTSLLFLLSTQLKTAVINVPAYRPSPFDNLYPVRAKRKTLKVVLDNS